jgi:hypothetical protein
MSIDRGVETCRILSSIYRQASELKPDEHLLGDVTAQQAKSAISWALAVLTMDRPDLLTYVVLAEKQEQLCETPWFTLICDTTVGRTWLVDSSILGCARAWCDYRDEHRLGASDLGELNGRIILTLPQSKSLPRVVARVSYNGRLWDPEIEDKELTTKDVADIEAAARNSNA